jgi:hypothetical protein
MQNWGVLLLVVIGTIVYVAMLFATKVVSKDMLKLLKNVEENPGPEIVDQGQL